MITCSTWAAERNWTHAAITHLSLDFGLYSSLYSYVYDVTVLYSYVYDVLGTISVLEYWVRSESKRQRPRFVQIQIGGVQQTGEQPQWVDASPGRGHRPGAAKPHVRGAGAQ